MEADHTRKRTRDFLTYLLKVSKEPLLHFVRLLGVDHKPIHGVIVRLVRTRDVVEHLKTKQKEQLKEFLTNHKAALLSGDL